MTKDVFFRAIYKNDKTSTQDHEKEKKLWCPKRRIYKSVIEFQNQPPIFWMYQKFVLIAFFPPKAAKSKNNLFHIDFFYFFTSLKYLEQ